MQDNYNLDLKYSNIVIKSKEKKKEDESREEKGQAEYQPY